MNHSLKALIKSTVYCLILISPPLLATEPTWHSAATNAHGIADNVLNFMKALAYISGTFFLVSSIIKYKNHRSNPQQVTIGTPITELFIGMALLILPSITSWTWDEQNEHNRYQKASTHESSSPIYAPPPPPPPR